MSVRARSHYARRQLGVSLIELLVALVVGLLLLGGLIQVYLSNKQSYNAQEQLARMQEGGRFAMDLITSDLRRSGYWGGNVDLATFAGEPPAVVPSSHICASAAWGRMINWRVSGVNDHDPETGLYACATDPVANTDILTVRYADANTLATVPANDGLFVRSTMFVSRVMTGARAGVDDNRIFPDDPAITPAHLLPEVRQLVSHAYYVGDSGQVCPGGQAIPALRRVALNPATGAPESELIATGVEQIQVRYLLNDVYVDAQNVPDDQWPNVRAVRVWLLMRGECPEFGLVNDTTYTMGDLAFTPAANSVEENYRRQLYVSTVMLRNIAVR